MSKLFTALAMKAVAIVLAGAILLGFCTFASLVSVHEVTPVAQQLGNRALDLKQHELQNPTNNAITLYNTVSNRRSNIAIWLLALTLFAVFGALFAVKGDETLKQFRLAWKSVFGKSGRGGRPARQPQVIDYPPFDTPPTISPPNGRLSDRVTPTQGQRLLPAPRNEEGDNWLW